jgi:hypothetical protein
MRIPIAAAFICADCESVCSSNAVCGCGSTHIFALAPILNRDLPDRALVIDSAAGMRFGGNVEVTWVRQ